MISNKNQPSECGGFCDHAQPTRETPGQRGVWPGVLFIGMIWLCMHFLVRLFCRAILMPQGHDPNYPNSCRCAGWGWMWAEIPDPAPGGRHAVSPCGCDLSRRMALFIEYRTLRYRRDRETEEDKPVRVKESGKYGKAPPSMDELVRVHGYRYSQFENKHHVRMNDDGTLGEPAVKHKIKKGPPPSEEVPF